VSSLRDVSIDRIRLTAGDESIGTVLELVRKSCAQHRVVAEHVSILELVCDELVSNIRRYAHGGESREFEFGIGFDGDTCVLHFTDSGPPFDFTEKAPPDTAAPLDKREIGGLGIFLVRKYADRVVYERRDDRNVVTIYKRVADSAHDSV